MRRGTVLLMRETPDAVYIFPGAAFLNLFSNQYDSHLSEIFEKQIGAEVLSCGSWTPFETSEIAENKEIIQSFDSPDHSNLKYLWSYLVLGHMPGGMGQDNQKLVWMNLRDPFESQLLAPEVKWFLDHLLNDPGNSYTPVKTMSGVQTFAHIATGEILHSQAGPFVEAEQLYIAPLGLRSRKSKMTVYDCGLGCGTLVIAARQAFLENEHLKSMTIVSFDLEKKGLLALKKHLSDFAEAVPHEQFIDKIISNDNFTEQISPDKQLHFTFVQGDFSQTVLSDNWPYPLADAIFYDFFSPLNHSDLWSLKVLTALRSRCSESCLLSTYSSATSIRACFAAAGFYVGEGVPSGKKGHTTLAASSFCNLAQPLKPPFLQTFARSQKQFLPSENSETQKTIADLLRWHPQFFVGPRK